MGYAMAASGRMQYEYKQTNKRGGCNFLYLDQKESRARNLQIKTQGCGNEGPDNNSHWIFGLGNRLLVSQKRRTIPDEVTTRERVVSATSTRLFLRFLTVSVVFSPAPRRQLIWRDCDRDGTP